MGWVAQAYLTVAAMGLCYLGWFATLRRLPAPAAATGMLLVPIVGSVAAALALGEPLVMRQVVALAVTLSGVTLALRR